jgi:hypothetical protein
MVFKVFYRAVNTYLGELDSLTVVPFMRASLAVRTELERESEQALIDSLRRSDPQVQEAVNEFFRAVMDSLRYNSPMLMFALWIAHHCARIFAVIRRARRFAVPVYDTYRYYETIQGRMGLAPDHNMASMVA